ncbi:uncharacterized protein LOC143367228 [Andrena cerasifolii]|uniref:uncharacterized protein LOC143367228 n=1 Tax=Andrena cerasifolii TaxID=2819439 RepID=UPI0040377543
MYSEAEGKNIPEWMCESSVIKANCDRVKPQLCLMGLVKRKRNTVASEQDEALNGQEARFIAVQKLDTETKTTFTQTSTTAIQSDENTTKVSEARTKVNHASTSGTHLELKKSSAFWNIDEDPAPQWLIEEALNRETERSERWTKGETTSNKESEYEAIISELEVKLSETKEDLAEALRTKSIVKEKYKRSLENVKLEARKENEILQDRIVRICTSVLENFGPRAMSEKAGQNYGYKCRGLMRGRKKISSKLHKKLRVAVARSNKLKRELATTRMALKSKSQRYESISKCFDKLKLEIEDIEANLNNLISENLALHKRMEETREWMEQNAGKEQREKGNAVHFRDIQRSREIAGLKKKAEEDAATITQLRNKLLRSESANANKGFLLSSYKSQLADLSKEKDQRVSKINCLENEISAARNSNSQLKAKISVLSKEKDNLLTDNGKSEADIREKMENQRAKNWEELMQREVDAIKAEYEETVKSMNVKMIAAESQNVEYSKAIKEFLKKLYEYRIDHESQKSPNGDEASEKEAHETACNILNMTPEELSGFINGKVPNSVSSWMSELGRIISRNNFSEGLSKFLFKKTMKKTKM